MMTPTQIVSSYVGKGCSIFDSPGGTDLQNQMWGWGPKILENVKKMWGKGKKTRRKS